MSLRHNTVWNLIGIGLPFILGAITIPYLMAEIGVESLGVLTLIWALIGYFSLFDFGLGRALTQQVAAARSTNQQASIPSLIKSGIAFTAITGLAGGILLALLADKLAIDWLKVSPELQDSTNNALLVAAIGIPLTTITTGFRGVLEAYEDFKAVNLLRTALGIANFGLPALCVMLIDHSLTTMVISLIIARFLVMLAHACLVNKKLESNWLTSATSKSHTRKLFSFGIWMTVSNIISPLMVNADRFIISAIFGASEVAYYTVPFEALIRVLILPTALTAALFPRLSNLIGTDLFSAGILYKKCIKIVALALLPVCLVISLGAKWGMTLWLGSEFAEQSWLIVVIMAVGVLFNGIAHVPYAAIQASGDSKLTASLHTIEFLLYIPTLWLSINLFGLIGAPIAWTIRVILDLLFLLHYAKIRIN